MTSFAGRVLRIVVSAVIALPVQGVSTSWAASGPVGILLDPVPPHSRVDVGTLPAAESSAEDSKRKPFRGVDDVSLAQWKDLLEQVPGALPPASRTIDDPALGPLAAIPTVTAAPTPTQQLNGLGNADNVALTGTAVLPSDVNLGVGPGHVFEIVNIAGRILSKTGAVITSFALRSFFGVDPGFDASDPTVMYDAISGRWFATYVEFTPSLSSSSIILVASTTNDPTATFCRYRLGNPTSERFLQDFPMLGVSNDKVVVSYNGFAASGAFLGAGFYVLNKADLTTCSSLRSVRFAPVASWFTPHPAQSLTSTTDLVMAMHTSTSALALVTVKGVPGVTAVTTASTSLAIRAWTPPPSAAQAGSAVRLDTGDDRVLSVAKQNATLWVAGDEACTPTGDTVARSCLRLIEVATDTVTVRQDMSFAASGAYHSYPAVRPDGAGNVHVVFTSSSSTSFASVRVTGRLVTDPVNTLGPSVVLRAGGGAQTDASGRMGDYSGAATDPADPTVVWVAGEYIRSTAPADWGTAIGRLQFQATASLPDLVETAVTNPPAAAVIGTSFVVTDTAKNQGTAVAVASTTAYFLSLDTVKSANDVRLTGSRAVPALGPGTSSTGAVTVTVRASISSGVYFLLACADATNLVAESNETNNCRASVTTIRVTGPDLVESAVSNPPTTAGTGATFSVTDTARNQGTAAAGASTTRYYLSLDTVKSVSDRLLTGSRSVPALAAGASSSGTARVTIPATTPADTYFLLACADDLHVIAETTEGNNCRASAGRIVVR